MADEFNKAKHIVKIENRECIELTGVKDVPSFNENDALIITDYGDIVLKGQNMRLDTLNLDNGLVKIYGNISALVYNEKSQAMGFFKRMFSA